MDKEQADGTVMLFSVRHKELWKQGRAIEGHDCIDTNAKAPLKFSGRDLICRVFFVLNTLPQLIYICSIWVLRLTQL
jgi:hypothetical protein